MTGRALVWVGVVVAVLALVGLGIYLGIVGLDKADKLASVIGMFIAVVGLGVSVYGLVNDRRGGGEGHLKSPTVSAQGERSIAIGGDNSGIASTGDDGHNSQSR